MQIWQGRGRDSHKSRCEVRWITAQLGIHVCEFCGPMARHHMAFAGQLLPPQSKNQNDVESGWSAGFGTMEERESKPMLGR